MGHDVHHVVDMGWSSKRNGELLRLMVRERFQGLLTVDQNFEFQQNLRASGVGVVVVLARTNRSMELHVLVEDSRLPDVSQWQESINALGFDLKLDPSLSVCDNTGFLPCTFKDRQSGIVEAYSEFEQRFAGRNTSANFRWGGDMVEMVCALVASAALAKLCDGVWFDPQEGACLNPQEALEKVKSDVAAAEL